MDGQLVQSLPQVSATTVGADQLRLGWRRLVVTLGLLALMSYLAMSLADGARLIATARELWTSPQLLAVFLLTYTGAFYLRAIAWRVLLPGGPGVSRLFGILQVALLANHLFPTKVGEVARVGLLVHHDTPIGPATSSTLLARLLDLIAVLLLAVVLAPLAGAQSQSLVGLLTLPIITIGLAITGCALLASGRLTPLVARMPGRLARPLISIQTSFASTPPIRLLAAFALIAPSWLLEAGVLWVIAQAAGSPLPLVIAAGATAFTIAFQGFQFTPGGLGLYEVSLTGILSLHGIDPGTGLTLAIGTHALKFAYSYAIGFPFLLIELLGSLRSTVSEGRGRHHSEMVGRFWTGISGVTSRSRVFLSRLTIWSDIGIAAIACLIVGSASWSSAAFWFALPAAVPLALLGRCHHLPHRLYPLLFAVPGLFVVLYGLPSADAGLVALASSGLMVICGRHRNPVIVLWPAFLAQVIAVASWHPLEVAAFGVGVLTVVLLARQWWLSHHPLPAPGPIPPGSVLAVVIPVHNEASTIGSVVAAVPRVLLNEMGLVPRVIVVDDGSDDGSAEVARSAGADIVIQHPIRRGLGAAVRSGLMAAKQMSAGAAVYLDGDAEYDPSDIPAVITPILLGKCDYVLGARLPFAAHIMRPSRRVGNVLFTALLTVLTGRRLLDGQTGFRAFSARALAAAEIVHDYNYAQVLTLDLLRKRMRLDHVAIRYQIRTHGRSFIRYGEYMRRVLPAVIYEVLSP